MPRAAAPAGENRPDNHDASDAAVFTTLRPAVAPGAARIAASPHSWKDASAVAHAFITNLSGGAACYDVDLGLCVDDAITEELTETMGAMRRLMALADSASWRVADAAESSAVVAARATTGSGDDSSTDTQQFTLHVDVAAARPITSIVPHPRGDAGREASFGPPIDMPIEETEPVGMGWGVRVGR